MNENNLPMNENESEKKKKAMTLWSLSLVIHLMGLVVLALVMIQQAKPKQIDDIMVVSEIDLVEPPKETPTIPTTIKPDTPKIVIDEVPTDTITEEISEITEAKEPAEEMPKGIVDAPMVTAAIGGPFSANSGTPTGTGQTIGAYNLQKRKRVSRIIGCNAATENSVQLALKWLADHQENDGHWDTGKYEGAGSPETDVASSGAALLAFLGTGYTDKVGKYKKTVKTAIDWIVAVQRPNGSFDTRNYANGICTMALAEAVSLGAGNSETRAALEKAVDYLLKQQNQSGFFDYTGPSNRDDMSVTGWCIMGLKSAYIAGIRTKDIKDAFHKCGDSLDKINGTMDNTSTSKGEAWYTPDQTGSGATGGACQAIAMLVRQYLGWGRSAPWIEAAAKGQLTKIPTTYEGADIYRVYYTYLTLFQQGGVEFKTWNEPVSKMIIAAQRQDGDFKGSWDLNGGHVDKGGRVLYTAFLCLTMEVYYRVAEITKKI